MKRPWLYLLAVIFTTLIGAIGLWHAVEKRFLFRSSHYIAAIPVGTAEKLKALERHQVTPLARL